MHLAASAALHPYLTTLARHGSSTAVRARSLFASERAREIASVAFIFGLATLMLHPVVRGDWPVGHDHPVHIARLAQVKAAIIEHGSLWVWSHQWFAGHPLNVTYPIGADLFVLTVQALSFGALPLPQAYAVAFLLFYGLFGYAAYLLVRSAVQSRIAGLITVVFLLTDPGNSDVGGWFWLVDAGVWTAALGMVPGLIGTVRLADLLANRTRKTAAAFGLCVALAVLCHPLHLIYFAIAVPLMCVCRFIAGGPTRWLPTLLLLGSGLTCGLLIASVWLVPFLWSSPYVLEIGSTGTTITKMGEELAAGRLFPRMLPLATAFGFIGTLYLLRARAALPLFVALVTFVCLALSTSSFYRLFGAEVLEWAKTHIVVERFLMLLKPFWYGAAAYLLVVGARAIGQMLPNEHPKEPGPPPRRRSAFRVTLLVLLIVCFAGPVVFKTVEAFIKHEVLRPTRWHSKRDDLAARAALLDWMNKELGTEKRFFRIAHGLDPDGHNLADLGASFPYPFYKAWVTPTGHFKYRLGEPNAASFRAANVRYVISSALMRRPDLRPVRSFNGKLHVSEFTNWNPQPFEIVGSGDVTLKKFTHKDIELRAKPGATGQLRLNVAYYPKWRATRDRVPVAITPTTVPGVDHSLFMQVPLEPGTYRFRYHKHPVDYAGTVLCLLGLSGCAALAFGTITISAPVSALRDRFARGWRKAEK